MDWNAIKSCLSSDGLMPWWSGLIFLIFIVAIVVACVWAIVYLFVDGSKKERADKADMAELIRRGYKKEVVEDFIKIYNAELKYIVKYKTIENELGNFAAGRVVSLPGKTQTSGGGLDMVTGMIIGSTMNNGGH